MFGESSLLIILIFGTFGLLLALLAVAVCRWRTGRRYNEQNLLLQTLINSIPSPIFYKGRDGIFMGCNRAFLTMHGRPLEGIVGKTVWDIAPPELAAVYEKADNELFESGGEQRYETQVKYADGSLHEVFFTKSVFRDASGDVAGLIGVMLDISDRKHAEDKLKAAHGELERRVEERTAELAAANIALEKEVAERQLAEHESLVKSDFLDTVINSINHGIVVIDVNDFSVKLANSSAASDGFLGKRHCFDFLHGYDAPCKGHDHLCPVKRVKETGKPTVVQHDHPASDGTSSYVEIHAYPVFNEQGEVIQVIENIMDITARKQAEQAMVEAKDMAETTSRLMSEFLDTVSHELRTPMTSVHGFAKLIDKSFGKHFDPMVEDEKMRDAIGRVKGNLDIIISESERLTHLINDHLDLSKLESGRMEWRTETIHPNELVERAAAATRSLFSDSEVRFEMDIQPDIPDLQGDPDRLLQVLINLISNAVKFTHEGSVTCGVQRQEEKVVFFVSDTGIGIQEDDFENIFSKFRQLQTKAAGKPAGTGLGLAISREIILHHDGAIWVESQPNQGSTFFFSLPVL